MNDAPRDIFKEHIQKIARDLTKACVEKMARDLANLPMKIIIRGKPRSEVMNEKLDNIKHEQVLVTGRRTGRTTAAMLAAPRGAIYVWCNGHLGYPRDLAKKLGRDDLQIVGPDYVIQYRFAGLKVPVATDHALRIHPDVRFHISNHNLKVKP